MVILKQNFIDQFDAKLIIEPGSIKRDKPIANGTFGAVYRAFWTPEGKPPIVVALKTVRDMKVVQQKDDARLNLMKKEGLCMRKLAHKNVIDFMVSLHTAFFYPGPHC